MSLFNFYISANLIIFVCWALFGLWNKYSLLAAKLQLQLMKAMMAFVLLAPLCLSLVPGKTYTVTTAQVWSAPTTKHFLADKPKNQIHITPFLNNHFHYSLPSSTGQDFLFFLFFIGFILIFIQFFLDSIKLWKIFDKSYCVRKIDKVDIRITDKIEVPFAFWSPLRSTVFLPSSILFQPNNMKYAIFHELQHHRQGDTQFAYVLALFKALFFFNPFIHLWEKQILETQEYACDEAVVGHNRVTPQAYGRCLIEVAQNVLQNRRPLFGTASMAASSSKLQLTRRLTMLLNKPRIGKPMSAFIIILSIVSLSVMAFGSKNMIKDRRIDMEEALRYQSNVQSSTDFPIDVNAHVLKQLNRFLGTPDGRTYFKEALKRKDSYQPMIDKKIQEYGIPEELFALPIIESGYKNIPEKIHTKNKSAGIWQFIPGTATNYDLSVHPKRKKRTTKKYDQRLDVPKATGAALRYLSDNHRVFNDWRLALMAYNMGELAVLRAITKANTRDPWELIEKGFEGDPNYLAKFMAAILILKNPHILE